MKALVYTAPKELVYRDEPDPVSAPGEAIIRVRAVGICGSDMHGVLGHDQRRPAPLILGHEAAGEVVSGDAPIGQRVCVNPLVFCKTCDMCIGGRPNLCRDRQIISILPRQGAFAEYLNMPAENFVLVPDGISMQRAAMAEPMACGWHLVGLAERGLFKPLDQADCLVIGGGAIGLGVALILAARGVRNIRISEPNALRHAAIRGAGDFQLVTPDQVAEDSADLVVDAVGYAGTRAASCNAVRPGGMVAHIGLGDSDDGLDIRFMTLQEVQFTGSYCFTPDEFRAAAAAIFDGSLGDFSWVETRALADGAKAFEDLLSGKAQAPKIALQP